MKLMKLSIMTVSLITLSGNALGAIGPAKSLDAPVYNNASFKCAKEEAERQKTPVRAASVQTSDDEGSATGSRSGG